MIPHTTLFSIEQIRRIEAAAKAELAPGSLMRAAGLASCTLALQLLEGKKNVLVLAGPGDNGGDALETAHLLSTHGNIVAASLIGDATYYSHDARRSLAQAQSSPITWIKSDELIKLNLDQYDLVIDGLFGIGLNRPLERGLADFIQHLNQKTQKHDIPVLALDVPSGLNADTGQIIGEHGVAVRATNTITFIGNKAGLHTAKARDYAGHINLSSLGIKPEHYPTSNQFLLTADSLYGVLPFRSQDSHKGSFGDVLIIGGNQGMTGAPILAARAALFCGTGRVHIGFLQQAAATVFDPLHPEIMCRHASDSDFTNKVIVIGPGLGVSDEAKVYLNRALASQSALVIDADALNLIATDSALRIQVAQRKLNGLQTILTPHPLEAARLLNADIASIQTDRCKAANTLSGHFQATIILKGAGSIIANQNSLFINSSGNPRLATAGTGDVLAGVCGAMLAQGLTAIDAANVACFVHGASVDYLAAKGMGAIGVCATEIIPAIRVCLNQIAEQNPPHEALHHMEINQTSH